MTPTDVCEIYGAYPRKVCRRAALLEIERAIRRLEAGEAGRKMAYSDAVFELLRATVVYAQSPAGNRKQFTPHPSSWYHQSRYLDDPAEWQHLNPTEERDIKNRMEANVGVRHG
jgi:hypothetical protein